MSENFETGKLADLKKEIGLIKKRNLRVGFDKAWEVSWTRRIFIALATYVVSLIWLIVINESNAALKALVPTLGYVLSTLSLQTLKNIWSKWFFKL